MASFNEGMRGQIAASMRDRPERLVHGETSGAGPSIARQSEGRKRLDGACVLKLERIIPDPDQPRTEFEPEDLARLAESLRTRGQLQPVRVRWAPEVDRYVIVVGERRWRAAQLAGLETLACVETTAAATPDEILEDQLVENALRENLKPIEQARAYKRVMDARGYTHRDLADRLHIGHATIARALALLGLPEPIQASVEAGALAPNTAYEISKVEDPAEQAVLAREAAQGRLKRDDVAARVRAKPGKGRGGKAPKKETAATFRLSSGSRLTIENRRGVTVASQISDLEEALGRLRATGEGRGEAA